MGRLCSLVRSEIALIRDIGIRHKHQANLPTKVRIYCRGQLSFIGLLWPVFIGFKAWAYTHLAAEVCYLYQKPIVIL